jgi:spermidine/putrescine transport system substrate-binding protein
MVKNAQLIIIIRMFMILCWMAVIAACLYAPDFWVSRGQTKSINVFTWSGLFDTRFIKQFEKRTGIHVNFSYYETNEELIVKLRASKGRGYDLIVPGDYAVDILHRENLLKMLDKKRLSFYNSINPLLLGHYFDPHNNYSLPFEWAIFGLGIDKNIFDKNSMQASWDLVFDKRRQTGRKIVMSNDPLVAFPLAAFYLFGSTKDIDQSKLEMIKDLLIKQKKWVEAYTDFRADYMIATKTCPLAVASSSYIWRSMKDYPNIDFVIPKEGSLITIENFAIPAGSLKENLVYEFINFMYEPETVEYQFNTFAFFPVTTNVLDKLDLSDSVRALLTMSAKDFARFDFFRYSLFKEPIDEQMLQDLWVTIKS